MKYLETLLAGSCLGFFTVICILGLVITVRSAYLDFKPYVKEVIYFMLFSTALGLIALLALGKI